MSLRSGVFPAVIGFALWSSTALAAGYALVHDFTNTPDGVSPRAPLIKYGDLLFGTTISGGAQGYGTIYSIDPVTAAETILYSFTGGIGGSSPVGTMVARHGKLYGTTQSGGSASDGVVFSYDLATKTEQTIYSFAGGSDGASPQGALVIRLGVLYGATSSGGGNGSNGGDGTLYAIDLQTNVETVLHRFAGTDGELPDSGVTEHEGALYGAAYLGGTGQGTLFRYTLAKRQFETLYNFSGGVDGGAPDGAPRFFGDKLWGVTYLGGAQGDGTIFEFQPASRALVVVYSFAGGAGGRGPSSELSPYQGALYGETSFGGAQDSGVVFKVDLLSMTTTVVHSFQTPNSGAHAVGENPGLRLYDHHLYGVATFEGPSNRGEVFRLTP